MAIIFGLFGSLCLTLIGTKLSDVLKTDLKDDLGIDKIKAN